VRNRYEALPLRERLPLRAVNHFVFVSKATWRSFAIRVQPHRGTILYDGIDPVRTLPADVERGRMPVRAELGFPAGCPLVGMVARVAPQKDVATFIEAAAIVARQAPAARFVLVGGRAPEHEGLFGSLLALARQRGMEDRFAFAGYRPDSARFMAAVDIFVLCTRWEGFPLVILEAMASGKPVIATDVDGVTEIVEHDRTGLLHPVGDALQLADLILRLLEDQACPN